MRTIGVGFAYLFWVLVLILGVQSFFDAFLLLFNTKSTFPILRWFCGGAVIYVVLIFLIGLFCKKFHQHQDLVKKNGNLFEVTSHEFTHAVVALMFGWKIKSIEIHNNHSGMVSFEEGKYGDLFVTLVPYCFPLFSFVLLSFVGLVSPKSLYIFYAIIGFITTFHISTFLKETRQYQTDIQSIQSKYGFLFPYIFILSFGIFNLAIILISIKTGFFGAEVKGVFQWGGAFKWIGLNFWQHLNELWSILHKLILNWK